MLICWKEYMYSNLGACTSYFLSSKAQPKFQFYKNSLDKENPSLKFPPYLLLYWKHFDISITRYQLCFTFWCKICIMVCQLPSNDGSWQIIQHWIPNQIMFFSDMLKVSKYVSKYQWYTCTACPSAYNLSGCYNNFGAVVSFLSHQHKVLLMQ